MISLHRLIAGFVVASCAALTVPAHADGPVVNTPSGSLEGTTDGTLRVFKGVPFAVPPLGGGRWRPPGPMTPWSGVKPAKDFGPACIQPVWRIKNIYAQDIGPMSEDCLTLNVWA